ncbi:MAG: hypothetical protein ACI4KM_04040 [Oscillospiraceae bacterium]
MNNTESKQGAAEEITAAPDETVEEVSQRLIDRNLEAYKELAK